MEKLLNILGQGAARNLVTRPVNTAIGGLGSGLELLDKVIQQVGGQKQELPSFIPNISQVEDFELKHVPKGYERTIRPGSTAEEVGDIALSGLNPFNLPKTLPALIKLGRSNLAASAGSKIAGKLGLGAIGQIAGGAIGHQLAGIKGKIPETAKEVQRDLYSQAKAVGEKNPVNPTIITPLKEHIQSRLKDLEKGLPLASKRKIMSQGNDILSKLGKQNVDINDIVGVTQDLNKLAYDFNIPAYEKSFYRTLLPKLKDTIKEYGKEVVEHGQPYEQAVNMTKFIKENAPANTLIDEIVNKVSNVTKFKNSTKNLIDGITGEGSIKDVVRFAATGKPARKALWDLQSGLIQNDPTIALKGLNLINSINSGLTKTVTKGNFSNLIKNAKSIEYLN